MPSAIDNKVRPVEFQVPKAVTGTRPTLVIENPLEFTAGRGDAGSTAAVLHGGGISTSGSRLKAPTATTANLNFMGYWLETEATSGDTRGLYLRLYFSGAGGSGEAARIYGTVNNVQAAVGGTVNGAHISLLVTGASGSISGAGNALRATLELGASTNPGGTISAIQVDSSIGASATVPATAAFFHLDNVGTAPTTNGLPLLFNILNPETSNFFVAAGTGANSAGVSTGGVAAKVLKISVGGTPYWIGLFSSNS